MTTADGRPRVLLGVAGGIAAYKVVELLRLLMESGHAVRVIPTPSALEFVGVATWAALSGEPVTTGVFDGPHDVPHVALGRSADLLFIAPASADLLARAAQGRADDLLTATLLTVRCPVVFAPAMHTEMWDHPATQANVATLRERGAIVLDPAVGRLTGADSGKGRLPEAQSLYDVARVVLARGQLPLDLAGRHVVVTAGGTREYLDPVRFLGNRSSGRQGWALATTAIARGARVTLIAANVTLTPPAGAELVAVGSARQLGLAVTAAAAGADVVVMAAAVADFRPAHPSTTKIKKGVDEPTFLDLVRNDDILASLALGRRPGQVIVGFAAETDDALANGRAKLAAKGADVMVVNPVGETRGFERTDNEGVILEAGGRETEVPLGSKEALADSVWDAVARCLGPERTSR
ncbi:MAG: phosphopantothenoylcysteine decarboxylase / phosphopantothenate---cysteine ligase [Frankiaceae bacterium]|nr:phosphopantothenoylcysteine decarboxylase / phosphopantothenate---cysteine ligase [Frankiaceae bacterium]